MKSRKAVLFALLFTGTVAVSLFAHAADDKKDKKPYPLTTCVVSDEKLGGDMGDPYIFIYKDKNKKDDPGREIRFCCKSCLKDFSEDPAKYLKKLDEAEAKAAKK